jgi:hypothetical protein
VDGRLELNHPAVDPKGRREGENGNRPTDTSHSVTLLPQDLLRISHP